MRTLGLVAMVVMALMLAGCTTSAGPKTIPMAVATGTLVVISDGRCGTDVFDLRTDKWYFDSIASAEQLMRGNPRAALAIPSSRSYPAIQPPARPSPAPAVCRLLTS